MLSNSGYVVSRIKGTEVNWLDSMSIYEALVSWLIMWRLDWAQSQQESWAIAKMTARCAVYMAALKISGNLRLRPQLVFPHILMDFCSDNPIDPVNMHTKFKVRGFTRSW